MMVSNKQALGRGIRACNQAAIRTGGEQGRAAAVSCFLAGITARSLFLECQGMKKQATLTPVAAYIRMSGRTQDKSPAEQRAETTKLATREGFTIVEWFTDEAISGDSSTEARAGLAALLTAAKGRQVQDRSCVAYQPHQPGRPDGRRCLLQPVAKGRRGACTPVARARST